MILEVCRDGLWTLSFGLSQFHGHGTWLVCEVALRSLLVVVHKPPLQMRLYLNSLNLSSIQWIWVYGHGSSLPSWIYNGPWSYCHQSLLLICHYIFKSHTICDMSLPHWWGLERNSHGRPQLTSSKLCRCWIYEWNVWKYGPWFVKPSLNLSPTILA